MMKDVGVPFVADPSVGLFLGYGMNKIILTSLFFNILSCNTSFFINYFCIKQKYGH